MNELTLTFKLFENPERLFVDTKKAMETLTPDQMVAAAMALIEIVKIHSGHTEEEIAEIIKKYSDDNRWLLEEC